MFVAAEAQLGPVFANIGMALDYGSSFLLPELVGLHKVKELVFVREPIKGEEAVDIGLVNAAIPATELDAHVAEWAENIAPARRGPLCSQQDLNAGSTSTFDEALLQGGKVTRTARHVSGTPIRRRGFPR